MQRPTDSPIMPGNWHVQDGGQVLTPVKKAGDRAENFLNPARNIGSMDVAGCSVTAEMVARAKVDIQYRFALPVMLSHPGRPMVQIADRWVAKWSHATRRFEIALSLAAEAAAGSGMALTWEEFGDLKTVNLCNMRKDLRKTLPEWPAEAEHHILHSVGAKAYVLAVEPSSVTIDPSVSAYVPRNVSCIVAAYKEVLRRVGPRGSSRVVSTSLIARFGKEKAAKRYDQVEEEIRRIQRVMDLLRLEWAPAAEVKPAYNAFLEGLRESVF